MDAHTLMEEWEVSPFDGGLEGVRDLQARGFSGAVAAGGSTLFLRDGDALAVVEDLAGDPRPGDIDALEGDVGDLQTAQRSETATLAAMLALDGDVRGQYFTEDTPLSTVHDTLAEGGFTGYVELSENVLSGDYYVVYRDGREEYVAFVGSSNRVLVDEEAQTRAEDEVGIYSVVGVSLPDVAVPRSDESSGTTAAGGAAVGGSATGGTPAGGSTDGDGAVEGAAPAEPGGVGESAGDAAGDGEPAPGRADAAPETATVEADAIPDAQTGSAAPGARTVDEADVDGDETTTAETEGAAPQDGTADTTADTDDSVPVGTDASAGSIDEGARESAEESVSSGAEDGTGASAARDPGPTAADSEGSIVDAVSSQTIPSLDPQNSRRVQVDGASETASSPGVPQSEPEQAPVPEPVHDDTDRPSTPSGATGEDGAAGHGEVAASSEQAPERAQQRDVEERVDTVREEYEGRLQDLRNEVEELRAEREELRGRIESLQSGAGGVADPDSRGGAGGPADETRSLSASEAIAGTSLFVREGTRGGATLEDALEGGTDRETLAENVRVEYHTEFDDDGATVEGHPFEEWLHGTTHYRFVRWAIVDLLFEIRSTGSASSMRPLYEALPAVDRVGLSDAVAVGEGEEGREITFDVVARDQMGDPLFVATIDERREPTTGEAIRPLVTDASDVCEYHESLAGTFSVTSSYFEPAALDTVREATSGSLLGRDRYRSYVKLARKNGFHLCMVERRNGDFHLTVPEL